MMFTILLLLNCTFPFLSAHAHYFLIIVVHVADPDMVGSKRQSGKRRSSDSCMAVHSSTSLSSPSQQESTSVLTSKSSKYLLDFIQIV